MINKYGKIVLLGLAFGMMFPLLGVTRVVNMYPGSMMKIPTSSPVRSPYLFSTGFATEIHRFSDPFNTARGFYFSMDLTNRFTMGFSSVQSADTTALENILTSTFRPPIEFGLHIQYRAYVYNDIAFSIGIHDIVFKDDPANGLNLNPRDFSTFLSIGSEKILGEYALSTYMGFGTGGFSAPDTASVVVDTVTTGPNSGIFAGFLLKTPFLPKWGGLDFVGEFDGSGINVGLRIPLTSDYRLTVGFTHLENLPAFSDEPYGPTHPGLIIGLDMSVPRGLKRVPGIPTPGIERGPFPAPETAMMDSTMLAADFAVAALRDSIRINQLEMRNLMTQVASVQHKAFVLENSVKALSLEKAVAQRNMNRAMRHLSRSLRYFYSGDYREALQEVETSLDLNPNLALAYARRGSIYYKLGDVQRATINWNLALQMDPEYDDVRNILKALHENRLKTTSFRRE